MLLNSKFKIQNYLAGAAVMTAANIVMPQLGKVLIGKYAGATLTQLINPALQAFPPRGSAKGKFICPLLSLRSVG